jgi:hypothetical protein
LQNLVLSLAATGIDLFDFHSNKDLLDPIYPAKL